MDRFRVAIVIPAFNEVLTIGKMIETCRSFGEVIVVNDYSTDGTDKVIGSMDVHVVNHSKNLGYDQALNSGFLFAQNQGFDIVITLDADGQHQSNDIKKFLRLFEQDQTLCMVLGIRPKKSRFSEVLMAAYYNIRFKIQDPLCGMKGYHLKNIGNIYQFDRFQSIGTDLLLRVAKKNKKIAQVSIEICKRRDDAPRFGSSYKANLKILSALSKTIIRDIVNDCKL